MKATIKDIHGYIRKAVNTLGMKLNPITLEMILNIAELVKEKGGETSIKDISTVEKQVIELIEEKGEQK